MRSVNDSPGEVLIRRSRVAGFYGDARGEIRRLAETLGIKYSGALVRNRTTHLVLAADTLALSANNVKSQKIRSAESWGIAVIRYAWIEDSLAHGKVLDANKYLLKVKSSSAPWWTAAGNNRAF